MKHSVLFFFAVALFLLGCQSDFVEKDTSLISFNNKEQIAVNQALNFKNNLGYETRGVSTYSSSDVQSVYAWRSEEIYPEITRSEYNLPDTMLYIVNFIDDNGFALVSANEYALKVVAYVEEGSLSPNDQINNPGLRLYLDNLRYYYDTIPHLGDPEPWRPNPIYPDSINVVGRIKHFSAPLLTTKWSQNAPFNNYCFNSEGVKSPAGCMAIAIGQIVAYHRTPTQYNNHSYLWDDILTGYVPSDSLGQESVAHFIRDIGTLLQMNYSPSGSSSTSLSFGGCLSALGFDYDSFNGYNYSICKNNINAGLPVYIDGLTTSYLGHAWVIDGYLIWDTGIGYWSDEGLYVNDLEDYVHCNWGWGGLDNGYFLSGVFSMPDRQFDDAGNYLQSNNTDNIDLSYFNTMRFNIMPSNE